MYDNAEFWTEDRCIQQRTCLHNVFLNPAKFPKADSEALWHQIVELEAHMLTAFPTVKTMRALTT